ncbi:MAG TPA: cupredoxin domain-containing protein [Thermoanaerobaculia bacterium]|jgi:cytochrome c oxidase subunit 2
MKKAIVLALSLISTLLLVGSAPTPARAEDEPRVVVITAKRFEFTPASITLKRGETAKLLVTSEDVTHGFFQRALKIDSDLPPGKTSEFTVTPETAGTFTIICHHFCGAQHAAMKMTVVVE